MIGVRPGAASWPEECCAGPAIPEPVSELLRQPAIALEAAVHRTEADPRGLVQPVIPRLGHLRPCIPEDVPAGAVARNEDPLLVQGGCVDPVADDACCGGGIASRVELMQVERIIVVHAERVDRILRLVATRVCPELIRSEERRV